MNTQTHTQITTSSIAKAFACWAQTHSLSDISIKSAQMLYVSENTSVCALAAMSMLSAVFYDPHYSSMESKRARIASLLGLSDDFDVGAPAAGHKDSVDWKIFRASLGRALQSDFVTEERTIHNASFPFCDAVEMLYGRDFIKDIKLQSGMVSSSRNRISSGLDPEAVAAINILTARFTQARLREEIYRETPSFNGNSQILGAFEQFLENITAMPAARDRASTRFQVA